MKRLIKCHCEDASPTLAPHCVPWHRPPGQVWCSAGEQSPQSEGDCFVDFRSPRNDVFFVFILVVFTLTSCTSATTTATETRSTPTAVIAGEVATQPPVQIDVQPK